MELSIKSLSPEILKDFLYFFDHLAFTDNPHWASCYCYCYHANCSSEEWKARTGEQNRQASSQLILEGKMHGFIAYEDNMPIAWCHADLKNNIAGLWDLEEVPSSPEKTGAIVCFIVAPNHRRKGIATRLLQHVCQDFKEKGYSFIEAYPSAEGSKDSENYHGPLTMYLNCGFERVDPLEGLSVVRKRLL